MGNNYFNSIPWREARLQLGHCRSMAKEEFADGVNALKGKKIVIVGCGAQGLNQGLCLRDSGLDVSYALREAAIAEKRQSWKNATENGFKVGTYDELIPTADLVGNLTPDKQHTAVITEVMKRMKKGSALWYSHGFNMIEEGMQIRPDITVVMCAPKGPGTEVWHEFQRGFGVPDLIAVHPVNDPEGKGWAYAKALAVGMGGSKAGVLESSFVAEVKSDLMGEQTILCGMLQAGTIVCFDKMVSEGIAPEYATKLLMHGWNVISEALKWGGITNMMDRLSNPAKIRANELSKEIKKLLTPLYQKHMDNIHQATALLTSPFYKGRIRRRNINQGNQTDMLRQSLILLLIALEMFLRTPLHTTIDILYITLFCAIVTFKHKEILIMHDNLRVNRIIGTATKREVIYSIQKISLTYTVMADKTINLWGQIQVHSLYVLIVYDGNIL